MRALLLPALAAAALLLLAARAHAHAVMINPKSRPWYSYLRDYNYNPHAVNGGGEWPQQDVRTCMLRML